MSGYELEELDIETGILAPLPSITSPANDSTVSAILRINTTVSNPSQIPYNNNVTILNASSRVVNTTVLTNFSISNVTPEFLSVPFDTTTLNDGQYIVRWETNNSAGLNFDEVTITIRQDVIPPSLNVTINDTLIVFGIDSVKVSSNATDELDLDSHSCNVSFPNGSLLINKINLSLSVLSNNISFTLSPTNLSKTGNYSVLCRANDTGNNIVHVNTSIFINDTAPPVITINEPTNGQTFNFTANIELNFTISEDDAIDTCLRSLNGGANVTVSDCNISDNNDLIPASVEGNNTIIVCANDSFNNVGCTARTYHVDTQTLTIIVMPKEEEYFTNESIVITSLCRFSNNTVCGDNVNCRLTSHYPNASLMVENLFMNNFSGGLYNVSLGFTNVTENIKGVYSSSVTCYDSINATAAFNFEVVDIVDIIIEIFGLNKIEGRVINI
jgi:hypothetical protein